MGDRPEAIHSKLMCPVKVIAGNGNIFGIGNTNISSYRRHSVTNDVHVAQFKLSVVNKC